VILEIPCIRRKRDDFVACVIVAVVFTPLDVQAVLIELRESLGEGRLEPVTLPDGDNRPGRRANCRFQQSRDDGIWSNFQTDGVFVYKLWCHRRLDSAQKVYLLPTVAAEILRVELVTAIPSQLRLGEGR
jgi:hypothetical protein